MEFNKKFALENIEFLLKQSGMKIGEFEKGCSVSSGYLSRIRDDNSKPSVDFFCKAASQLGVTLDDLLGISLSTMTPTEQYLHETLKKVSRDLSIENLDYDIRDECYVQKLTQYGDHSTNHPLFHWRTEAVTPDGCFTDDVNYFVSNTFGQETYLSKNFFEVHLFDEAVLYVFNVSDIKFDGREENVHSTIELWIGDKGLEPIFLCSDRTLTLAPQIKLIYQTLKNSASRPKIKTPYKIILDLYLEKVNEVSQVTDKKQELPY